MLLKKVYSWFSSLFNYYYHFTSVYQHAGKKLLAPGFLLSFTSSEAHFLALCARSFNYAVDYSRGYWQKEVSLTSLQQVTFLGNTGALVWKGKVVAESVFDQLRLSKSPAFRSPAFMVGKKKKGLYTSLLHLPWAEKSNFHWFLDCLPRLYALLEQVRQPVALIIPENMPDFQLATLQFVLAGNPYFKLVSIKKTEKWHIESFLLPSFVSNHYSGFMLPPMSELIRQRVWQGYGIAQAAGTSRIYISRAKATKRRLVNEEEVQHLLLGLGFQVVFAEELSYREQVALFYNAEVVVGVHGAGLTNILFGKHLNLVELHSQDLVRSHYFMVCKALNFPYHYLVGDPAGENQDFRIDPSALSQLLNWL